METHYHSQFDNEDFYDEPVYRFHHNLYGKLVLAFDHTAVVPMDFERLFAAVEDSVDRKLCEKTEANETVLLERLKKAKELDVSYMTRSRRSMKLTKTFWKQENMKKQRPWQPNMQP